MIEDILYNKNNFKNLSDEIERKFIETFNVEDYEV
jgi:hypothetical protein